MGEREVMRELEDARIDPPEPEEPAKYCAVCGEGLYLGDHYFCIDGDVLCDECAEDLYGCCVTDYEITGWEE